MWLKLSFVYGIPESELRKRLTSRDLTKLIAADNCGLIPDPWTETGMICATIANVNRGERTKPYDPEQFIPRRIRESEASDAKLMQGFEARKRLLHGDEL